MALATEFDMKKAMARARQRVKSAESVLVSVCVCMRQRQECEWGVVLYTVFTYCRWNLEESAKTRVITDDSEDVTVYVSVATRLIECAAL